jgi:hypothetical protein
MSQKNSRRLANSTNAKWSDNRRANRALPKRVATWAWTSFQMGCTWARMSRPPSVSHTARSRRSSPPVDPDEPL